MKILLLMILLSLSACTGDKVDIKKDKAQIEKPKEAGALEEEELDEIEELIENMTLEEKIGQLFIFGLNGDKIDKNAIDQIGRASCRERV